MPTNNPVFNVLATAGNQAPLAAGARMDTLKNGQIGVFNVHTGLSVDGSVPGDARDIVIAVGINRTSGGTATAEDISTSAGQVLQVRNTRFLTIKPVVDAIQQIWDISLTQGYVDRDYVLKLVFDSTKQAMVNGYNQVSKSFNAYVDRVSDTVDTTLPSNVLVQLRDNINADPEKAVTAYIVDTTTTPGTAIIVTDIPAWLATGANAGKFLSLRLVGNAEARPANGDVYIKYYKSNRTFQPILSAGFEVYGAAVQTRTAQIEEGSGYDLKERENFAAGWGKPGPYRTNAVTGLPNSVESFVSPAGRYTTIAIGYDQFSVAGWLEHLNNLETKIGIPCADTTTLTGLVTIFDLIFTQFQPHTNDAAGMDCTNTNVSTINNYALDGIESLA